MKKASALLLLFLAATLPSLAQQRPAITGIAFLRLYTEHPEASQSFYENTLGFPRTTSGPISRYTVSDIQWIEVEPLPMPAPQSRLDAVAFTTRDAAALAKYLTKNGVAITEPLQHGTFGVKDPEGNRILFVQSAHHPAPPAPHATSHRIIHAGFMVHDVEKENAFYQKILGFHPNWHGGRTETTTDWVSLQVPEGSDWLEYMLNAGPNPNLHQLGSMDHFSLGTNHMSDVVAALARNHCEGPNCAKTQMGRDGKVQLNLFDPDLTRAEFMEFKPTQTPCCSPILGKAPTETEER